MKPCQILKLFVKLDLRDACDGKSGFCLNEWLYTKEDKAQGNKALFWIFSGPVRSLSLGGGSLA